MEMYMMRTAATVSPARRGAVIDNSAFTAGNARQLSEAASACVIEQIVTLRRDHEALGIYRGMVVAGCLPGKMGIGATYPIPTLLKQQGLKVADLGLRTMNQTFACQALYCRDQSTPGPNEYNAGGSMGAAAHFEVT
jgi:acetyl-CoA acetyltransferase